MYDNYINVQGILCETLTHMFVPAFYGTHGRYCVFTLWGRLDVLWYYSVVGGLQGNQLGNSEATETGNDSRKDNDMLSQRALMNYQT